MRPVRILDEAAEEAAEAAAWYEAERLGLGNEFFEAVDTAIDLIEEDVLPLLPMSDEAVWKAPNAAHQPRCFLASAGWACYAHKSREILIDVKCPVEYTQNVNTGWCLEKIGNPIMPIEKNPDFTFSLSTISVSDFRKIPQHLGFFVNP